MKIAASSDITIDTNEVLQREKNKMEGFVKRLNRITLAVMVTYTGFNTTILILSCTNQFDTLKHFERKIVKPLTWETSTVFLILALVQMFTSYRMIKALKMYFEEFYIAYKCYIWTAATLLTVPLSFRSIFDCIQGRLNEANVRQFWRDHPSELATYNIFFFIFTTYLPIVF